MSDTSESEPAGDADIKVEALARELAEKLRATPNRQELVNYAVSLLRDINEEAEPREAAQRGAPRTSKNPFNPVAFGIPLLVIGLALYATGILIGPGLEVIAIALLMVVCGFTASSFSRHADRAERTMRDHL